MPFYPITEDLQKLIDSLPETVEDGRVKCPNCPLCDGYGHIIDERGGRPCPNALKAARTKAIDKEMAGWEGWPPPTLAEMRGIAGFEETPSFLAVKKMAAALFDGKRPQGIILCGGHGRSKTLSALALIRECAERNISTAAVKFPTLISEYKRGVDGQPSINKTFRKIDAARFVFIDEYGRDPGWGNVDHSRFAIEEIVNKCYRQKFLVLASNLMRAGLVDPETGLPSDVCSRLSRAAGYCAAAIEEPTRADLRGKLWENL